MIVLCGRTFRRNRNGWRMMAQHPGWGDTTFDATEGTTFEWRLLAVALDIIDRADPKATTDSKATP